MDVHVERFLEHLEYERNLSPNTVTSYRKDLLDLSTFFVDHFGAMECPHGCENYNNGLKLIETHRRTFFCI